MINVTWQVPNIILARAEVPIKVELDRISKVFELKLFSCVRVRHISEPMPQDIQKGRTKDVGWFWVICPQEN